MRKIGIQHASIHGHGVRRIAGVKGYGWAGEGSVGKGVIHFFLTC